MKDILQKINEIEKQGYYRTADSFDNELVKIAQMNPAFLTNPNPMVPMMNPLSANPLNPYETATLRKLVNKQKSENNTDVLSPKPTTNQNQTTIEKRLTDLLSKYLTLDKKTKKIIDQSLPPIMSANEAQKADIESNTQDIMNLKTQLGNTETEEPEEPTV